MKLKNKFYIQLADYFLERKYKRSIFLRENTKEVIVSINFEKNFHSYFHHHLSTNTLYIHV